MKPNLPEKNFSSERGLVSVIATLFLALAILFILAQSLMVSGSKSLESQQQHDSVAAQALAESGLEASLASLEFAVKQDDTTFQSTCGALSSSTQHDLGRGKFQTTTISNSNLCEIRVQGMVNSASRTLDYQINFKSANGNGGYGQTPAFLQLNNPYSVPAMAIFNLAWRRQGSTGQNPPGGQANGSSCSGCGIQWNFESSSGQNSVGAMGTALPVAAGGFVSTPPQTLDSPRNYSQVGLMLGGFGSTTPTVIKSYWDKKETANTSSSSVTGTVPGPTASNWCVGADTLVFGVSGRGADDVRASYTALRLNGVLIAPGPPGTSSWMAHYPNTDGSSPTIMKGDVFSEVWYKYNKFTPNMTVTNVVSPKVFTVSNTYGLVADASGPMLQVYSGTGKFTPGTKVSSVVGTTITLDSAAPTPNPALAVGDVICSGICALFDKPSIPGNKTNFQLTRDPSNTDQQWASGFVCLSGVDPSKVRRISDSSLQIKQWHEVISGE